MIAQRMGWEECACLIPRCLVCIIVCFLSRKLTKINRLVSSFLLYRKLCEITCCEHRIASFCKAVRKWERPLAAFLLYRKLREITCCEHRIA